VRKHIEYRALNLIDMEKIDRIFDFIFCRNVMIYFDRTLQNRVHELFYESLASFGVLGLGHKESISFSPHEESYEELDAREKLYRKIG
jgi:chemotaxis protein methyltransferase CheR